MDSTGNASSSTTIGAHQAEAAAAAAVVQDEAPVTVLHRRPSTDTDEDPMSLKRPKIDDTDEGHSSDSSSSSSSSSPVASSASTSAGNAVANILHRAKRAAESTPSYCGRLNDAPRRGAYRKSTEIGHVKYAAEFLRDFGMDLIDNE